MSTPAPRVYAALRIGFLLLSRPEQHARLRALSAQGWGDLRLAQISGYEPSEVRRVLAVEQSA